MNPQRVSAILSGEDRSASASIVRAGTALTEPFYRAGVAVRNAMFDRGWRKPVELGRPTISVGNITTGGTGKTPMVIEIALRLKARGLKSVVLMRGFGSEGPESDEARVIKQTLGDSAVEVDPNRVAAARRVLNDPGELSRQMTEGGDALWTQEPRAPNVFLLDDGFQHRHALRHLDLVLIDATNPFGFDHLLPRGLLREPLQNLRRADAIIVTQADAATKQLDQQIEILSGHQPLLHARSTWTHWHIAHPSNGYFIDRSAELPPDALSHQRVFGVCGIGNPTAFNRQLQQYVKEVVGFRAFPDHHNYAGKDLLAVAEAARTYGAEAFVLTEKDWVKWGPLIWTKCHFQTTNEILDALKLPIYWPTLRLAFDEGDEPLNALLRTAVP